MSSCILTGSVQTTPQVKGSLSLMLSRTFKGCVLWYLLQKGLRESCLGVDKFDCVSKRNVICSYCKGRLLTGEPKKTLGTALGVVSLLRHPVMSVFNRRLVAICECGCQHWRKRTFRDIKETKALQPETERRSS